MQIASTSYYSSPEMTIPTSSIPHPNQFQSFHHEDMMSLCRHLQDDNRLQCRGDWMDGYHEYREIPIIG
jgi:hypothetical protein